VTDQLDQNRPLSRLPVDVASRVHVEVGHDLTVTLEVRSGREPHELIRFEMGDGGTLRSGVIRALAAREIAIDQATMIGGDAELTETRRRLAVLGLDGVADVARRVAGAKPGPPRLCPMPVDERD
jgi:hypothetical protein